jgi:DNA-directed RNA polymerase alpha subunit
VQSHPETAPWPPTGLSAPARRALERAGIVNVEQLAHRSEKEVLALHGLGPAALKPLRAALAAAGLSLTRETE